MKNTKLQKEINKISKLSMVTGELFIVVDLKARNAMELDVKSNLILSSLIIPEGFELSENLIYRKDLDIYISFRKITE